MWDIQDFTGTLYTQHETTLGHLLQSARWLDNQAWSKFEKILPWEYKNILALIVNDIQNWRSWYKLEINPTIDPIENYCSTLTSNQHDSPYQTAWSFMHIIDLQLHDASVTYTYKAADASGDLARVYADIACNLWQYSRQLRMSVNRPGVLDEILSGLQ